MLSDTQIFALKFYLPILIFVVLPVLIVGLVMLYKAKKSNNQKEILQAALEKDAGCDIESLIKQMNSGGKSLKQKMLDKLMWGCILCFTGAGVAIVLGIISISLRLNGGELSEFAIKLLIISGAVMGLGLSFIANYFASRKLLAKELEAEEQKKPEE